MAVDPGLSMDCRSVLRGGPAVARETHPSGGEGYLRRIMLRAAGDGQAEELIVNYEPSMSAQRLELTQVRKHLADALGSVQDPFAYYDEYDCLVHFNQAYARLHGSSEGEIIAGMLFEEILRRDLRNGLIDKKGKLDNPVVGSMHAVLSPDTDRNEGVLHAWVPRMCIVTEH